MLKMFVLNRGPLPWFVRHPLLSCYLYFASFSVIGHGLIYASGMSTSVGLRQSLLMSVLWLLPILLWPSRARVISALLGLLILPASLLSFGYWLLYGQDFSQSVIFIIFESNPAESREFLESYFRWWQPLAIGAYVSVLVLLWRQISNFSLATKPRLIGTVLISLIGFWPLIGDLAVKGKSIDFAVQHQLKRMEPVSPWSGIIGYQNYRQVLTDMNSIIADNSRLPPLQAFTLDQNRLPDKLVIVIGESTNRQRMGLYGYGRNTTPKLDSIRDQLAVFNDVISPRPYTIESLQQVLSFADQNHPDKFFTGQNVINILKQAGYHTSWITNQQTQTHRNTLLTSLAQMADEQVFLNNNRDQNASQFDDVVLAPYRKALAENYKKHAIIVHLLGTHRKYNYRYPDDFARFNNRDGVPAWVPDEHLDEYNSYDDAVLFNDSVVYQLIEYLNKSSGRSMLVYFSDHGEEVYDHPGKLFCGRNEASPTAPMYMVPFIVWHSDHNLLESWQQFEARPYQTSDFIYSLTEMMGIGFDGYDASRSLISAEFVPHQRLVGDPKGGKMIEFEQIK